jgi:hypothetical protein
MRSGVSPAWNAIVLISRIVAGSVLYAVMTPRPSVLPDEDRGDRHLVADGAWPHIDERIAASRAVVDHHKGGASLVRR